MKAAHANIRMLDEQHKVAVRASLNASQEGGSASRAAVSEELTRITCLMAEVGERLTRLEEKVSTMCYYELIRRL